MDKSRKSVDRRPFHPKRKNVQNPKRREKLYSTHIRSFTRSTLKIATSDGIVRNIKLILPQVNMAIVKKAQKREENCILFYATFYNKFEIYNYAYLNEIFDIRVEMMKMF